MSTPTVSTGELLTSEPLPAGQRPSTAGASYRISYRGMGYDGEPRTITGTAHVPPGRPPARGWPLVSYAHGTVGLADSDAPSRSGLWADERTHLEGWLSAGYAVAVTDYEGLGAPGPHPYLNGRETADDVIDAVRATRSLDHPFDDRWLVLGLSQGGQTAIFAGDMATRYAPELDFRGTIALAPPSHLSELYGRCVADPDAPVSPLVPILLSGLSVSHPGFDPRDYLPDAGDELADVAESGELFDVMRAGMMLSNADAGVTEALAHPEVRAVIDAQDIPTLHLDRPLFLGQGLLDEGVPPDLTGRLAAKLVRGGSDVGYVTYPDATHTTILAAALADLTRWAGERLAGPRPADTVAGGAGRLVSDLMRAKLIRRFDRLDEDGGGSIERDDYLRLAERLVEASGRAADAPEAEAVRRALLAEWDLLNRADTDGDGEIDLDEFITAVGRDPSALAAATWASAAAIFDLVDTDGSNTLDRDEFANMMAGFRVPRVDADEGFNHLDLDGNGVVDRREFALAVAQLYTGDDENAPGNWLLGRP